VYSAIYYPHTEIEDVNLLKNAMLLWDTVTVIVPSADFQPSYPSEIAKAWEIVGDVHYPSDDEKRSAHELIEDFATRPLPAAFHYRSGKSGAYEIYPEKLMKETWDLLAQTGLTGQPLPNADYPFSQAAGLSLMSILADCCAGNNLVRITDESAAYASLAGLLIDEKAGSEILDQTRQAVVSASIRVLDLDDVPIHELVAFRNRERAEANGFMYTKLRHRYVDRIEAQTRKLQNAASDAARTAVAREFDQEMQDDVKELKRELRFNASRRWVRRNSLPLCCSAAHSHTVNSPVACRYCRTC
jgi:hypothetical protein